MYLFHIHSQDGSTQGPSQSIPVRLTNWS